MKAIVEKRASDLGRGGPLLAEIERALDAAIDAASKPAIRRDDAQTTWAARWLIRGDNGRRRAAVRALVLEAERDAEALAAGLAEFCEARLHADATRGVDWLALARDILVFGCDS